MRILLAVHHFPPAYTGGSEWLAFRLATGLQLLGHEVRVICVERIDAGPESGVGATEEIFEGVPVRRLSFNLSASPDPFRWEYDNPWIGDEVGRVLDEFRPSILLLVGGYLMTGRTLQVAHERGIPTAVRLCDFWFLCKRITLLRSDGTLSEPPIDPARCARCTAEEREPWRQTGRLFPGLMSAYWNGRASPFARRNRYLLEQLNLASVIISPSRFTRDLHVRAGVDAARVVVIDKGCELPAERPPARQGDRGLHVGYVGQVAPHKGVELLPEALRLLPDASVRATIYGNPGPFPRYAATLRRMARRDPRIVLAGRFEHRDRARVLSEFDVVVVPSVWYENSPNAIHEALAHGKPVIASDLGTMRELVTHEGNGLLFEAGSAVSLAGQLQRLQSEPELLPHLQRGIARPRPAAAEAADFDKLLTTLVAGR